MNNKYVNLVEGVNNKDNVNELFGLGSKNVNDNSIDHPGIELTEVLSTVKTFKSVLLMSEGLSMEMVNCNFVSTGGLAGFKSGKTVATIESYRSATIRSVSNDKFGEIVIVDGDAVLNVTFKTNKHTVNFLNQKII